MSEPDKTAESIRVRRGPRPLAQEAGVLLKHHLSARGFAQIELVTRWAEIAGQALGEHCFPYRLSAPGASGSTLTLIADDRAALELQHQAPKLIDKINAYFGRTAVSKIKVVAGDIPRSLPARRTPGALTAEERAELDRLVHSVQDLTLRDALTRLGRHALAESRRGRSQKR